MQGLAVPPVFHRRQSVFLVFAVSACRKKRRAGIQVPRAHPEAVHEIIIRAEGGSSSREEQPIRTAREMELGRTSRTHKVRLVRALVLLKAGQKGSESAGSVPGVLQGVRSGNKTMDIIQKRVKIEV